MRQYLTNSKYDIFCNSKSSIAILTLMFIVANLFFANTASSQCLSFTSKPTRMGANNDCTGAGKWINPGNIVSSDDSWATTNKYNSNLSDCLDASSFGFNIPSNATITGIEVKIEKHFSYEDSNGNQREVRDNAVQLLDASGTAFGNNLANTTNDWKLTNDEVKSYGGSSNLWGATITPAIINDVDFGLRLQVQRVNGNQGNPTALVDYIEMKVYYTLPTTISAATSVCASSTGNTASVNVSGASAWNWTIAGGTITSGAGTSNIIYTAGTGSSVTLGVTVTTADGNCTQGSTTVSIDALPTVTANASKTTVNSGESVTLTASATPLLQATTLLSENFNDATNLWTKINTSTGGTPANAAWTLRPDGYDPDCYEPTAAFHSNDNSQFYQSSSCAQGSGATTATILRSPVMSTVGYTTLSLDFYHFYRHYTSSTGIVQVSTNGTSWTTVASYTSDQGSFADFAHPTINLNSYINNPTFYVRFKYDGGWVWYWSIDNVTVSGTKAIDYTYSWAGSPAATSGLSSGASTPSTTNSSIVANPTQTTSYVATAINSSTGCSASSSPVLITVVVPNSIATGSITGSPFCAGTAVSVPFTITGTFNIDNVFTAQLSDASGSFSLPVNIGTLTSTAAGTISGIIPVGTSVGTGYRIRVVSSSPSVTGSNNGSNLTVNAPPTITAQPSMSPQTVCQDGTATALIVAASGTGLTYQWYSNMNNSNNGGTLISGATSASYTPSTSTVGTLYYYCVVSGSGCLTPSNVSGAIMVVPPVPDFTTTVTNTTCSNSTDGAIVVSLPSSLTFSRADDDYIDCGTNFLSGLAQFTIEGWVNVDKTNIGNRMGLFGQNDAIEFGFISSSQIECYTPETGAVHAPLTSYPNDNGWHHIAAVGTTTTIIIYIDGVQVGTGGTKAASTVYGTSTDHVNIGSHVYDPTAFANGGFTGQIAKVGFYNTALSAASIANLATGFTSYSGNESGLIAGYNFYEGTGTTLSSLPAGKTGTFAKTPVWTDMFTYAWTKTGDAGYSASTQNISGLSTGEYNLTVSNSVCPSQSKSFTVNSSYPAFTAGAIPIAGESICSGSDPVEIGSSVAASGGNEAFTYKWQSSTDGVNYTDISSSDAATYNPSNLTVDTWYKRFAKDGSCSEFIASDGVYKVTVLPSFNAGSIATTGQTICSGGDPVEIGSSVAASGGNEASITYKWQANGVDIVNSNSETYNPPSGLTTSATYTRWAKDNTCNTSFTQSGGSWVVTINAQTAVISQSTDTQTQCLNGTFNSISVTASGTGTLSYQWYSNGSASTTGGTSLGSANGAQTASYTPQAASVGTLYYYCVVNGTCGSATSAVSGAFVVKNLVHTNKITMP